MSKIVQENASQTNEGYLTEGQNTALAAQLQGQWRSISTALLQTDTEDDHPIFRKEVEAAVQPLKKGKSAGVEKIPAELV